MLPTGEDISQEEWEEISERASKPLCFNFLVGPKVPEHAGTLLDRDENPVMLDFNNIDWGKLANKLQSRIDGYVPKSIKVYVANDGPDLFDINEFCFARPNEPEPENGFVYRTAAALRQVSMKDYRGGLLKIPPDSGLHLNPVSASNCRPPLAALIVSIKFRNMMQTHDYISITTKRLFGHPVVLPLELEPMTVMHGPEEEITMPTEMHEWLEEEIGAVYSQECVLMLISATYSE